jgi:hypothetical protein
MLSSFIQNNIKIFLSLLLPIFATIPAFSQSWITEIHVISQQLMDPEIHRESKKELIAKVESLFAEHSKEVDFINLSLEDAPVFQDLISPDSSFRIITAHAIINKDEYIYYGGLYDASSKQFIPFRQDGFLMDKFDRQTFSFASWYGAVYYGVYLFKKGRETSYLLFGVQNVDYFTRMKVMDVLSKEGDTWKLGKSVFHYQTEKMSEADTLSRFYQVYAAEAPIVMNYDENEEMIVFDHLMPIKGMYPGQETAWVPDGTYSGFKWSKGYWRFVEKLENQVLNEPPRDFPVLDNRENRDILGRQKKQ